MCEMRIVRLLIPRPLLLESRRRGDRVLGTLHARLCLMSKSRKKEVDERDLEVVINTSNRCIFPSAYPGLLPVWG